MKKVVIAAAAVLVFLLVFWVGLMLTFPGQAVSRFLESQFNRYPGVALKLSPARLLWNGLEVDEAVLRTTRGRQPVTVLTLRDVTIPLPGRVFSGLTMRARVAESGQAQVFWPWNQEQPVSIAGTLNLAELAVNEVLPATLSGNVRLEGALNPAATALRRGQLPPGRLTLRADAVAVQDLLLLGQALPPLHFDSVQAELEAGNALVLRTLTFAGDLSGRVSGSLAPDLRNPQRSRMNFTIKAGFAERWLAGLGPLRVMAESFLTNGALEGRVSGTVAQPRFQPAGRGGAALEAREGAAPIRPSSRRLSDKHGAVQPGGASIKAGAPRVIGRNIPGERRLLQTQNVAQRKEALAAKRLVGDPDTERQARLLAQREERRKRMDAARAKGGDAGTRTPARKPAPALEVNR